jgi:polysaccharide deacetylase family protein (PEP-CTERM system associated)
VIFVATIIIAFVVLKRKRYIYMTKNILTIDLEDWFQSSLELFGEFQEPEKIFRPTGRVVRNTRELLDILKEHKVKATFFVLGTVAEDFPDLIKEVYSKGHEIATHGYGHKLIYKQTKEEFRQDLRKSLDIIESIIDEKMLGYRAPYFSIREDSSWVLEVLKEMGLKYDASIFPLKRKLYGVKDIERIDTNGIIEFPTSKTSFLGYEFPFGGGGYLRLFPYAVTKWAIRKINNQGKPAMVYIHPYEIDTEDFQDYGFNDSLKTKFTRFTQEFKREKTQDKIKGLLRDFEFTSIKELLK